MIRYLYGEVTSKNIDEVIVEVGGVGYGVRVSLVDYERLSLGSREKILIHEHIKEDAYDLDGFASSESLKLFRQLLSVKNVGPKVALALLSMGSERSVREAIASGDVKKLQRAKGVGKRAAEQIVVELRDKVGLVTSDAAEGLVTRGGIDEQDEALQALLALGYSEYDAALALQKTDPNMPTEERIKQALKA